jgi:hypothetical protein
MRSVLKRNTPSVKVVLDLPKRATQRCNIAMDMDMDRYQKGLL